MSRRINRIVKDKPDLAGRDDIKALADDIDAYAALAAFASSEAGKIVFASMSKDIASTVSEIATGYKSLSEIDLRALGAKLDVRITFLQSLKRARTNLDDAEAYLKDLIV